jgi:tRNA (guanine37-N1)-methyltransferase
MIINYLTIFPEIFPAFLDSSILGRAKEKGLVEYHLFDIRDYADDEHRAVDDKAFGGEPGMVMMVGPLDRALEASKAKSGDSIIIITDAVGEVFDHRTAVELSRKPGLTFICGRYKGVDERIKQLYEIRPISIGDYIISGGEPAALVMTEAIVRLVPGVLGNIDSAAGDSFYDGLLSSPVYTRPSEYKGLKVPDVLLSGDHARIQQWRHRQSLERTERIRPDLYRKYMEKNSVNK